MLARFGNQASGKERRRVVPKPGPNHWTVIRISDDRPATTVVVLLQPGIHPNVRCSLLFEDSRPL